MVYLSKTQLLPTLHIYSVSQEVRSIFWEVIVLVILSKCEYASPILNGFQDRAISQYSSKIVDKRDITYYF
jgi:hypothetical protein